MADTIRELSKTLRELSKVGKGIRGVGEEGGRIFGGVADVPKGYHKGHGDWGRAAGRDAAAWNRYERERSGGGYGGRYGRRGGMSLEDQAAIEELRHDPRVQAVLEEWDISPTGGVFSSAATPAQIIAAANEAENRLQAQAGAGAAPPYAQPAQTARQQYPNRAQYEADLHAAQNLPAIQAELNGAPPTTGNLERAWESALSKANGGSVINDATGHHYLKQALQAQPGPSSMRQQSSYQPGAVTSQPLPPPPTSTPASSESYELGDRGNDVASLQRKLSMVAQGVDLNPDGIYGPLTQGAVKQLRQQWGMGEGPADGTFMNRLNATYNQITGLSAAHAGVSGGEDVTQVASQQTPREAPGRGAARS